MPPRQPAPSIPTMSRLNLSFAEDAGRRDLPRDALSGGRDVQLSATPNHSPPVRLTSVPLPTAASCSDMITRVRKELWSHAPRRVERRSPFSAVRLTAWRVMPPSGAPTPGMRFVRSVCTISSRIDWIQLGLHAHLRERRLRSPRDFRSCYSE